MRTPEWGNIPERMRGGIIRYLENGIEPGHFLMAVISNDLREACGRADDENRHLLWDYVYFFYNYAPSHSWGSPERYNAWINRGGMRGGSDVEEA